MDDSFIADDLMGAFAAGALHLGGQADSHHPVVAVAVGEQAAWIDVELARLIYAIWSSDIWTDESCQDVDGDGRTASIAFPEVEELRRFLARAVPFDPTPGGLYDRATGATFARDTPDSLRWRYELSPRAPEHYPDENFGDSHDYYLLCVAVRFPRTDIPALVAAFESSRGGPPTNELS